ncbi:PKD-like family lipoprotein [Dysgonomonas reticulitermitis]
MKFRLITGMKKTYNLLLIIALFPIMLHSCFEDRSDDGTDDLLPVLVSGLDNQYEVYSYRDILRIDPTVQNENRYEFCWLVYSTKYNPNEPALPKADTLSFTKNLDYEVFLEPGQYILIFNVQDKETKVTTKITSDLFVSTLNMKGWYLLITENNKTDFDFIYSGGRIDKWIKSYNGESLDGNAIKAIFSPQMKPTPTSSNTYNTFFVISDKDAGIYRIDNGLKEMGYNDMFFTAPDNKKPETILQPTSTMYSILINDGKMYVLNKGGRFAHPPVSTYKLSPIAAVGAMPLLFDENSKSIVLVDGVNFQVMRSLGSDLTNMNADIVWIASYINVRSQAIALLLVRKADGSGTIFKFNVLFQYLYAYGSGTPIIESTKDFSPSHGLMNADKIAGNCEYDYIYYAKNNNIYQTDINSAPEKLLFTLPAGETITCMQHVRFPDSSAASTVNYFVIATTANGKYKVRFYDISTIGELAPSSSMSDIDGDGSVACINYLEQGNGSRIY